jgi:hypothetical protein
MTVAVAHRERESGILDLLAEVRPPFSPDTVTETVAHLLNAHNIRIVTGDRYAGDWPREAFRRRAPLRGRLAGPEGREQTSLADQATSIVRFPPCNAGRVSSIMTAFVDNWCLSNNGRDQPDGTASTIPRCAR